MCQDADTSETDLGKTPIPTKHLRRDHRSSLDKFRNGVETATQAYNPNKASDQAGKAADVQLTRRLHESWNYYDRCYNRERNKGKIHLDMPRLGSQENDFRSLHR